MGAMKMNEFVTLCLVCTLAAVGAGPAVSWHLGGMVAIWTVLMIFVCLLADALHDFWKFLDRF